MRVLLAAVANAIVWGGLGVLAGTQSPTPKQQGVLLRERAPLGQAVRVSIEMNANGTRPSLSNSSSARAADPTVSSPSTGASGRGEELPFQFESRLIWVERVLAVGQGERASRVVRRIHNAEGTIDFFRRAGQKMVARLRPELSLLVAERRGTECTVVSAGGPLSRPELDLVQVIGDPLLLADLLPEQAVEIGESWDVPPSLCRALSEYDTLASSTLKAKLVALDEGEARIELAGELRGSARGAEGSMALAGDAVFDRRSTLVSRLSLQRAETRRAGPVETALQAKSTLRLNRSPIAVPTELSDEALKDLPLDQRDERRELLLLEPPNGRYTLLHDRHWHLVHDDVRRIVLKRVENGRLVAQCDLATAPSAGRGRHQDLGQFCEDIRKALGELFGQYLGAGEVDGAPAGGFRYKVGVEGIERGSGVVPVWYYYLIASPEGEQLVAVFTLSRGVQADFDDQDRRIIGSFEWKSPPESAGTQPR